MASEIPMPEKFIEHYTQAKAEKKSDETISRELFVSLKILFKWKRAAGFTKGQFTVHRGVKPSRMPDNFKTVYAAAKRTGASDKEIAKAYRVARTTITKWKKKTGIIE
jgi:hypothetical protein